MMKLASRVWVECFQYPTEDPEKVSKAIETVSGEPATSKKEYESVHGPKFWLLSFETGKQAGIRKVLENILLGLSEEEIAQIKETLEERISSDGVLHIRLDKQLASQGKICLGKGGDVVKVRIKLAAYPASRENLLKAAEGLLS